MSRTLSQAARQAINAEATEQVFLLLLTIDHEDLAEPIRVVNNTETITSRGELYVAYPFVVEPLGEPLAMLNDGVGRLFGIVSL